MFSIIYKRWNSDLVGASRVEEFNIQTVILKWETVQWESKQGIFRMDFFLSLSGVIPKRKTQLVFKCGKYIFPSSRSLSCFFRPLRVQASVKTAVCPNRGWQDSPPDLFPRGLNGTNETVQSSGGTTAGSGTVTELPRCTLASETPPYADSNYQKNESEATCYVGPLVLL